MRVGVIGTGVVGLACAAWAQMRGHVVKLIDPGGPGEGCSAGNAGLFSLSSFVPLGLPGAWRSAPGWLADPRGPLAIRAAYLPRLLPWLWQLHRASALDQVEASADAMHSLLARTWDAWLPLAQWAGASQLIRRDGWAAAYRSQAALDGDALGWRLRRERGVRITTLRGGEIRDFDPTLSPSITHLLHLPDQGHCLDSLALSRALGERLQAGGAATVAASARGFGFQDGRVVEIQTDAGPVAVDAVVVATGAYSAKLSAALGVPVPLDTERGYHVHLATPGAIPRVPLLDAAGKWFVTPMQTGLRVAGAVEFAGLDAPPDWRRADALLDGLPGLIPQALGAPLGQSVGQSVGQSGGQSVGQSVGRSAAGVPPEGITRWMGRRPSLPDSRPVIGRTPLFRNAILAFGHGHVGLTSAAMTGRLVAELLDGEPTAIDLRAFAPDRFGRPGRGRNQAS